MQSLKELEDSATEYREKLQAAVNDSIAAKQKSRQGKVVRRLVASLSHDWERRRQGFGAWEIRGGRCGLSASSLQRLACRRSRIKCDQRSHESELIFESVMGRSSAENERQGSREEAVNV